MTEEIQAMITNRILLPGESGCFAICFTLPADDPHFFAEYQENMRR